MRAASAETSSSTMLYSLGVWMFSKISVCCLLVDFKNITVKLLRRLYVVVDETEIGVLLDVFVLVRQVCVIPVF